MPMPDRKRRRKIKNSSAAEPEARLVRVRPGNKKKKKASSGPSAGAAAKQPVYIVLEHGVEEPTHSVVEVAAGAALHPLLHVSDGMSFAAVGTRYGPRIVGVGVEQTTVYDPKTSTEIVGPRLVYPKMHPVLIPHGSKLYALSRSPAVLDGLDFVPWFFVLDLNRGYATSGSIMGTMWRELPPPPVFPCRLNPLEYQNPPEYRVESYAVVGSHILLSVNQDKGTCAFDVDAKEWEMVDDKENLPFTGQAVHLDGHLFVACSKAKGGAATVYYIEVFPSGITCTGKTELSIVELPLVSKGIVPGQLLCFMGKGSFSSFDVPSVDPSPESKLHKARIVHRTYSQVEGVDPETKSVVIAKQQRQIFKLHDPFGDLDHPSQVVAALAMDE